MPEAKYYQNKIYSLAYVNKRGQEIAGETERLKATVREENSCWEQGQARSGPLTGSGPRFAHTLLI